MKVLVFLMFTFVSVGSHSSIIYEFEEIEMFNQKSDSSDSGLLSGFIEYAQAGDIESNTFKQFSFVFTFDGQSISFNESVVSIFSAVDLDDGLFGDDGFENDNTDAEGFEFNFAFADGFVTLVNGVAGFGDKDTCFFYDQSSSVSNYCAGKLISLSTNDSAIANVSAPNTLPLLVASLLLVVVGGRAAQVKQK